MSDNTRVFIVDDDQYIVKLLSVILEKNGFEIMGHAFNGKMAIEKLKLLYEKPDVIIMDYRMLIMNGIEATIHLKEICNHSKIIFATADNEIREEALQIGVADVISKPFEIDMLIKSTKKASNL
ncbi:MAG: response regulator [Promethearchaeota archaeon]